MEYLLYLVFDFNWWSFMIIANRLSLNTPDSLVAKGKETRLKRGRRDDLL
jgi:hypothetical protein